MGRRNDTEMLNTIRHAIDALGQAVETLGGNLQREISEVRQDTEQQRRELAAASTTAFSDLQAQNRELRDALRTTQGDIAAARQELQALRAETEVTRREAAEARIAEQEATTKSEASNASTPQPAPPGGNSSEPDDSNDGYSFEELLNLAAGIAYAELVCHRDTWAFIVERAIRGEHFRLPADIDEHSDGTMDVDISGRTLIAVIDALWNIQREPETSAGTRNLARQTYTRIEDTLKRVHAENSSDSGTVPRIVIDDRHAHTPDEGARDSDPVEPLGDPGEADQGDAA
jgi:hypothetical protein